MKNSVVGIDLGKREMQAVRVCDGKKLEWFKCGTNAAGEQKLRSWVRSTDTVVLEAGGQTFRIAKRLIQEGCDVIVLNPGDIALIYKSLKKTDKEDCLKLARLAQRHPREELPVVQIPDDETVAMRRLATSQSYWSKTGATHKNHLHSLFTEAGLTDISKKHLATEKQRAAATALLPECFEEEAARLHSAICETERHLAEIDASIQKTLRSDLAYTSIVMSMPGIGPVTALALRAYLGDCSRFSNAGQVSYYVGLVPRVDISGDSVRYGRIIQHGCTAIRRVIVQGAWALSRSSHGGQLKEFYVNLKARKGSKKAVVALARKMLEVLYAMIQNGETYRDAPDKFLKEKLLYYGLI